MQLEIYWESLVDLLPTLCLEQAWCQHSEETKLHFHGREKPGRKPPTSEMLLLESTVSEGPFSCPFM